MVSTLMHTAIFVHLAHHKPNKQTTEYRKDNQYNACIQIISLNTTPHFEYLLQILLIAEIAYYRTSFNHLLVGILYWVYLHTIGFGTEEIA